MQLKSMNGDVKSTKEKTRFFKNIVSVAFRSGEFLAELKFWPENEIISLDLTFLGYLQSIYPISIRFRLFKPNIRLNLYI